MDSNDIVLTEHENHVSQKGIISILEGIQAKYSYLPQHALKEVAEQTGRSRAYTAALRRRPGVSALPGDCPWHWRGAYAASSGILESREIPHERRPCQPVDPGAAG